MSRLSAVYPDKLADAIARFSSKRDDDLSKFLKQQAFEYESKRKSRTYFLLDLERLLDMELEILAYFTIAPQVFHLPDNFSNRQRKILDGISGKRRGRKIESLPAALIGQLAKNDPYCDEMTGTEILKYAVDTIRKAADIIGGRIVMVEAKTAVPALISFYERNGFRLVSSDAETGLSQLIYILA